MSKLLLLLLVFAGVWFMLNGVGLTYKIGNIFGYGISVSGLVAFFVCVIFASRIK